MTSISSKLRYIFLFFQRMCKMVSEREWVVYQGCGREYAESKCRGESVEVVRRAISRVGRAGRLLQFHLHSFNFDITIAPCSRVRTARISWIWIAYLQERGRWWEYCSKLPPAGARNSVLIPHLKSQETFCLLVSSSQPVDHSKLLRDENSATF